MVVDDDAEVRRLSRTILTSAGYSLLEAASGQAAVLLCEHHQTPIHLAIVDVMMPKISGKQAAGKMVAARPGLKILLMSGYPKLSGVIDGAAARVKTQKVEYDFIQKPFKPAALLTKVREILDRPPVV